MQTPSGKTAFVGKSAAGNDRLIRNAGKEDLWFHVKGMAGAHVLLPRHGGTQADPLDVEFAAGLAVDHSKAGPGGKTEVMMALVKDIGRLKGALPGQVRVRKYRTVLSTGTGGGK